MIPPTPTSPGGWVDTAYWTTGGWYFDGLEQVAPDLYVNGTGFLAGLSDPPHPIFSSPWLGAGDSGYQINGMQAVWAQGPEPGSFTLTGSGMIDGIYEFTFTGHGNEMTIDAFPYPLDLPDHYYAFIDTFPEYVYPHGYFVMDSMTITNTTPIPGAIWLLGSGVVALLGIRKRMAN